MIRFIVTLILTILGIALIRSVIGIVMKFLTGGASTGLRRPSGSQPGNAPVGGTLRRCPVCGTYTSEAIALKRVHSGNTVFYCSPDCEKKALSQT